MSAARFPGFPDRLSYLPVPVQLFGTLLREIDSLAELKVTLHCWRLLQQQRGALRYLRQSALEVDRALLQGLHTAGASALEPALHAALAAACDRGTLLCLEARCDDGPERCYFLNTAANRRLIERIAAGEVDLGPLRPIRRAAAASLPRPGIYELYEQNIGLLTPLLAEELREAELQYPADWIEDAFREAVAYNRRNWRYIQRVLEGWKTRGRGDGGETRGYPQPPEDPGKYLQGRYAGLLKR